MKSIAKKFTFALFASTILIMNGGLMAQAQPTNPSAQAETAFTLAPLPYAYDALEPVIDAKTMETHHGKHHAAYVNNLNAQVEKFPELKTQSLEETLANISKYPAAVRNNGGGHWNHTFFWNLMTPKGKGGKPSPELEKAITEKFGSLEKFTETFNAAGVGQFGSGWVWLVVTKDKKIEISATPNQDNPLMGDAAVKGTPIIGNDVWEHAYYLQYQNRRADYLKAWWEVVNWNKVNELYAAATK